MDKYTMDHLMNWAVHSLGDADYAMPIIARIIDFTREHPGVLDDNRSWPEIRALADRWADNPNHV